MALMKLPTGQRSNFLNMLTGMIRRTQEEDDLTPEKAFNYTALEILGFNPDDGKDIDGANDGGIDFLHIGEQQATLFQFKSTEYGDGIDGERVFDASYIEDTRRTINILQNIDALPKNGLSKKAEEGIIALRSEIARQGMNKNGVTAPANSDDAAEAPSYKVVVYFVGLAKGFSVQAQAEFDRLIPKQKIWHRGVMIDVETIQVFADDLIDRLWSSRNTEWKDKAGKSLDQIELHVSDDETIRSGRCWVFFADAFDFVEAFDKLGYQIFEPNVRAEIKDSRVNQAIRRSIETEIGREEFRHLNNGITVICENVAKKMKEGKIERFVIRKPGIVNGLQTVRSIHDAYNRLDATAQDHFKKECAVLVRLHEPNSVKRPEDLVKSTNNQNPMKPRNLRSNDPEQKQFERLFAELGWFFERKQGSWDAFRSYPKSFPGLGGRKPEAFRSASGNGYRKIDNDELAQNWLAFIGYSTEAINLKKSLFEEDVLYRLIFLARAAKHGFQYGFDRTLTSDLHKELIDQNPSPEAMLLAYVSKSIADQLVETPKKAREEALARLKLTNAARDKQEAALAEDETYQAKKITRASLTLFVEFVGFAMYEAFGSSIHEKAAKILATPSMKPIAKDLDFAPLTKVLKDENFTASDPMPVLIEMFKYVMELLASDPKWQPGYIDAPVKNKFIYSTRSREAMIKKLMEIDKLIKKGQATQPFAPIVSKAGGLAKFLEASIR